MRTYHDRAQAGRHLGEVLADLGLVEPVILALPRGGVPVAAEVADHLRCGLDVFVARKVGAPGHVELGIGAVTERGVCLSDDDTRWRLGVSDAQFQLLVEEQREEAARRVEHYRGDRRLPDLAGRTVVVVDDGLATGVTAAAALDDLREDGPARLVLAAPVGALDTVRRLGDRADDVVCPLQPDGLGAVGQWYDVFDQTPDDEVVRLLRSHQRAG
ncbi:MAG TPA: phosphoribosyltransferase family protein [Aquihabitans sp.]|jgi:predicted phosphoribosyltransferase|nr:phosphoribosyltransferase family protein [Aquihabitans sp.]